VNNLFLNLKGTCAGCIFLAKHASHVKIGGQTLLNLMDIDVDRNFFGRQLGSFHHTLPIKNLGSEPFQAIFIRAPMIVDVKEGVEVLAELPMEFLPEAKKGENQPKRLVICARQGNLLASVFHPELTDDTRLHQYFLEHVVHHDSVVKENGE